MFENAAHRDSPRIRNGPDFICIGLQKAGSRWLYEQLREHPDFWMPPIKELRFFNGNVDKEANLRVVRASLPELTNRLKSGKISLADLKNYEFLRRVSTYKQSRSRKSAQDDKWSFCLTAGTLCPSYQERP